jgi:hypothetical protein
LGQSVITRVIAVAEGVFAPGHLGELTRVVPFEMVDAVLAEAGGREQRVRKLFLSGLLNAERLRRGTRTGRRALGCFKQAVLILRWFLDGTRIAQLATDNAIGSSTTYRYLHEGIDTLAARQPDLHSALLAAKTAGHSHVNLDGTLIETDRVATPGPTAGVDLW